MSFVTEMLPEPTQKQIDNYLLCKDKHKTYKEDSHALIKKYVEDKDKAKDKEEKDAIEKKFKEDKDALKDKFLKDVNKNAF